MYSSITSDYYFNNHGRIGLDATDNTQRSLQNTRFAEYSISNFFQERIPTSDIDFASQQPTMSVYGLAKGKGLNGEIIDYDSQLLIHTEQERALEKLQLFQRPFLTVPYLGRGSADPMLESQLQQGEPVSDKKSVSTIMDKSFMGYVIDPNFEQQQNVVEENALNGWVYGGTSTRNLSDSTA